MEAILRDLECLLVKYGHEGQARCIANLIELLDSGQVAEFAKTIRSVDVWGGAGAVWEVGPFNKAGIPQAESREDTRLFRASIAALADAMDEQGIGMHRAREIAATHREWDRRCL